MRIVFPGETDSAVNLDVLARAEEIRVRGVGFRRGGELAKEEAIVRCGGDVRRIGDRARGFDLPEHVRGLVLDGLKAPDWTSELFALERIGDRHIEATLGSTDLLDGERRTCSIEDGF